VVHLSRFLPGRAQRLFSAAVLTAASLAVGAAPAHAAPALSITAYKITSDLPAFPTVPSDGPSTLQAGANPDAGSYTTFGYANATEDVKTALTNFAPGLLGNPESVAKCPEVALQAGGATCPTGSAIGTSRLDTRVAIFGVPGPSLAGTVYNAEPLGNEPGRLGVVTPTGPTTFLVSSIPFTITPRGASDYGLTGTLTDINRLPTPPNPFDLQVAGLSFVINGSANKYVRNPTSCGAHTSTGQAIGYDDPAVVEGPAYTFNTTGCETVAFNPTVSIQIGDRGSTTLNKFPPFALKITPGAGDADLRNTKITLPTALNTNNSAYKLCSEAQAAADSCPANSKFGNAFAKSPFLASSLSGPVYLLQQTGRSLPGLLLDLNGRAHVKIQTTTQLVNSKQIQSLATDSPQLPISELRIGLNGGRSTGVFQNRNDLCFKGSTGSKFRSINAVTKLEGWNGKSTGDKKIAVQVLGCGPGVSGSISRPTSSRPSLTLTIAKHPDAGNMKELTLSLGRNLSLVKSRLGSGGSANASAESASLTYLGGRKLKVGGLPSGGASKVTITLREGAVKVSKTTRRLLRRGRTRKFHVKVKQEPVSGAATSTRGTFKVKGR
jgi:hypothetical protein